MPERQDNANTARELKSRYYYAEHRCFYRVVNRSQKVETNGLKWIERCRCGCIIICEGSFSLTTRKAEVKKTWFDRDGFQLKVTGANDASVQTNGMFTQ